MKKKKKKEIGKQDSVYPWKPVAFVDIPIKTTWRVKASSKANKQIYFWVIIITLQVVNFASCDAAC